MKGVILEKGLRFYTHMKAILEPIKKDFIQYNWLITDCECNYYPDDRIQFNDSSIWISGEDFLELVENEDIQFIWAVFSGFPKAISQEQVMEYPLPYADGYTGFWKNPLTIQHPLAEMEIVPWDSSLVLIIGNEPVINRFQKAFPLSEDLEVYNVRM